jgi:hypothetical protein
MKILKSKSGPLGPDQFENDYPPATKAERLARLGAEGVAKQEAIIAKLKAHIDKIKKARR